VATATTTTTSPKPVREKDSNENLNCPEDFTKAQQTATDDLPSGGSNVPVTQDASNAACHLSLKRRTRSEQEGEDPPKRAHPCMQRMDSADSESSVAPQPRRTPGVKFRSIKVTLFVLTVLLRKQSKPFYIRIVISTCTVGDFVL
jgi:hypothetical protein